MSLDVYVGAPTSTGILDGLGNFLADGSVVAIFGSVDNIIDPPETYGVTNLIGLSTTGDDVLLAVTAIGVNVNPNTGEFVFTISFDTSLYNYIYIRFFESELPLEGYFAWGTSTIIEIDAVILGVGAVDMNTNNNLQVSQTNNFVVIPEPSTMNLFAVMAGLMWVMRSQYHKKRKQPSLTDEASG